MTLHSWIRMWSPRPVTRSPRRAPRCFRPALETLEDRLTPSTPSPASPVPVLAAATVGGVTTKVHVTYSDGTSYTWAPFGAHYKAGATVALGDVTGDGYPDIVVASGDSGTAGTIQVYDGLSRDLIASYTPLGSFGGGLDVAVGDVDNSGHDDIVVGVYQGGWPLVTVLDGATGTIVDQFLAYSTSFGGGVRVAAGDISNAGYADVVVAPGAGQHSLPVEVYSGQSIVTGTTHPQVLASAPTPSSYTGAVSVAVGYITSTSYADIVVGTQSSGEKIQLYSGAALSPTSPPTPLFTQNAWAKTDNSGVKVALVPDASGNGLHDPPVTNGTGSKTARYLNSDLTAEGWPTTDAEFFTAIPGVTFRRVSGVGRPRTDDRHHSVGHRGAKQYHSHALRYHHRHRDACQRRRRSSHAQLRLDGHHHAHGRPQRQRHPPDPDRHLGDDQRAQYSPESRA